MNEHYLLTEEYVEFSKKIANIFEQKKQLKAELKAFYEATNLKIEVLEAEAAEEYAAFENQKTNQTP